MKKVKSAKVKAVKKAKVKPAKKTLVKATPKKVTKLKSSVKPKVKPKAKVQKTAAKKKAVVKKPVETKAVKSVKGKVRKLENKMVKTQYADDSGKDIVTTVAPPPMPERPQIDSEAKNLFVRPDDHAPRESEEDIEHIADDLGSDEFDEDDEDEFN